MCFLSSFYSCSLFIFSLRLIYLQFFFLTPSLTPAGCPHAMTPTPPPTPPPTRCGSFHFYGPRHQPFIPRSTFLIRFPFCFVFNPSLPSFPWPMFKTKLLICLSFLSLSVLFSLLPFAPGFSPEHLPEGLFYIFVYTNNKYFTYYVE